MCKSPGVPADHIKLSKVLKGENFALIGFWQFDITDQAGQKTHSRRPHALLCVRSVFFIIKRSISKGFVLRLYFFSKSRSFLYSLSSRSIAATKPGCHCITVSLIDNSFSYVYHIFF